MAASDHRLTVAQILGKTFMDQLTSTADKYAPLRIGSRRWSKNLLVTELGTGNFHAARNLSKLCVELKITTVNQLLSTPPEVFAACKGLGDTTLFVIMKLQETYRAGVDISKWYRSDVSFNAMKRRETKGESQERKTIGRKRSTTRSRTLSNEATNILEGAPVH